MHYEVNLVYFSWSKFIEVASLLIVNDKYKKGYGYYSISTCATDQAHFSIVMFQKL